MSANVDDKFYGQFTAALTAENTTEVEEAYMKPLALGNGFTVRGGRFNSGIGYLNGLHAHAWDFADQPLVYRALLGNQYKDDGVQLRWVAPTDLFMEFGAEAFSGGNFPPAARPGTARAPIRYSRASAAMSAPITHGAPASRGSRRSRRTAPPPTRLPISSLAPVN